MAGTVLERIRDPETWFLVTRLLAKNPDLGRAVVRELERQEAPPPDYRDCPTCEGTGLVQQSVRLEGGAVYIACPDCAPGGAA